MKKGDDLFLAQNEILYGIFAQVVLCLYSSPLQVAFQVA